MFRFFIALFIGASFLQSSGAASITRPSFSVQNLGTTHPADKSFKNVHRDGGGGGFVNGKHLIVFSDTATMNGDQMTGFTCNSVAYVGSAASSAVLHRLADTLVHRLAANIRPN